MTRKKSKIQEQKKEEKNTVTKKKQVLRSYFFSFINSHLSPFVGLSHLNEK